MRVSYCDQNLKSDIIDHLYIILTTKYLKDIIYNNILDRSVDINMNKDHLRKKFIEIRRLITDKDIKSHIIMDNILTLPCLQAAKTIAMYSNLPSEVRTAELTRYLLKCGKEVYYPKVLGGDMEFYRINDISDVIVKGSLGIKEPTYDEKNRLDKNDLDIVIMPGICFDKSGNRIGFGKGYYDRYLKETKNVCKIAICFEEQLLDKSAIDSEEHDIRADIIVTDKGIYHIRDIKQ